MTVAFTLLWRTYTDVGRGTLPGGARGADGADGNAARPERVSSRAPSGRGALPKVQLNVPTLPPVKFGTGKRRRVERPQ